MPGQTQSISHTLSAPKALVLWIPLDKGGPSEARQQVGAKFSLLVRHMQICGAWLPTLLTHHARTHGVGELASDGRCIFLRWTQPKQSERGTPSYTRAEKRRVRGSDLWPLRVHPSQPDEVRYKPR